MPVQAPRARKMSPHPRIQPAPGTAGIDVASGRKVELAEPADRNSQRAADLDLELPEALVPRRWRVEVNERTLVDGQARTPLDLDAVVAAADCPQAANKAGASGMLSGVVM